MTGKLTGPSVLALVADKTGPTLWRVFWPITALGKAGYPCGWEPKNSPWIGDIASSYDGYIMPRTAWQPEQRRIAQQWFESIHRAGRFVVYEADDDIFTPASTHRAVELNWTEGKTTAQLNANRLEGIWAMQQCDAVTVSTPRLATIVRQYTDAPVVVVPNAIDLAWFRLILAQATRQVDGVTVGWAGGRRHDRDTAVMAEAWGRVARRHREVRFVVIGWLPDVIVDRVPHAQLVHVPWMQLETYPVGLRQIDVGCCAVADTPFNRAKSNIKAMEYAVAGAAVVASPTLYEGLVEHDRSGFICRTVDEWEAAITAYVERPSLRSLHRGRLLKRVERDHSLAANLWRWPAAWEQARVAAEMRRILYGTGAASSLRGRLSAT